MSFFLLWDILWLFAVLILWEDFPEIGSFFLYYCAIMMDTSSSLFLKTIVLSFFFFYTKCSHCYYLSLIFFILRPRIFFSLAWSTFFTIISAIELVTLFNNILIFEAFYKSIPFCNDLILKSHEYFIRFKIFPSENAGV